MNPGIVFSSLPLVGIAIGLLRVRVPRLPWIAAGVVVLAYVLYLAAHGVYAARCWSCSGDVTATRGDSFIVAIFFFGGILVVTLAGIALGARLTVVLGRLRDAARDVRDGFHAKEQTDASTKAFVVRHRAALFSALVIICWSVAVLVTPWLVRDVDPGEGADRAIVIMFLWAIWTIAAIAGVARICLGSRPRPSWPLRPNERPPNDATD